MEHYLDETSLEFFTEALYENEKGELTIQKYLRDVRKFKVWLDGDNRVDKTRVIRFKKKLQDEYKISSANSILSALNTFFGIMGWEECKVKTFRTQKASFRSGEKELTIEEYFRLLKTAEEKGEKQLYYIMETLACTGIRISELRFVTVEALSARHAIVSLKGKARMILLPADLCARLKAYAEANRIRFGSIFVTRHGNPVDRSNVLHKMKECGREAGVRQEKVYPHNLRHLFAVTYYEMEKDIAHLADILGHTNVNTTRIYTMTSSENQLAILDQMGKRLLPEKEETALKK